MVSGNNRKICEKSEAFVNIAQGYCAITDLSFEQKECWGYDVRKKKHISKSIFFNYLQKALSIIQTIESLESSKHFLLVEISINVRRVTRNFLGKGNFSWN